MPRKPKRPCSHPGCPELTDNRFCLSHERQEAKRYEKYSRDPNTKKYYGSNWKKRRAIYIAKNPLCVICKEDGKVVLATEVHHKTALRSGGSHAEDNLMSLCRSCHSRITATEGGRWG